MVSEYPNPVGTTTHQLWTASALPSRESGHRQLCRGCKNHDLPGLTFEIFTDLGVPACGKELYDLGDLVSRSGLKWHQCCGNGVGLSGSLVNGSRWNNFGLLLALANVRMQTLYHYTLLKGPGTWQAAYKWALNTRVDPSKAILMLPSQIQRSSLILPATPNPLSQVRLPANATTQNLKNH